MYFCNNVVAGSYVILVLILIFSGRSTTAVQSVKLEVGYVHCWKISGDVPFIYN